MATDYISREAALDYLIPTDDLNISMQDQRTIGDRFEEFLKNIPAADVVSRGCFNRILAENDTMREQLAAIGKKPGDKMDNVRPIRIAKWECEEHQGLWFSRCSGDDGCGGFVPGCTSYRFCPNCGADMREEDHD